MSGSGGDAELFAQLKAHEGVRLKPYRDTVGKLTIGVGRNLDDVGLSLEEADQLLTSDLVRVRAGLDRRLPWWRGLDGPRRAVLLDMGFNLGVEGLLQFTTTLAHVRDGRYGQAADQMLQSRWAGQVGRRATTLSRMMRAGVAFADAVGVPGRGVDSERPPS